MRIKSVALGLVFLFVSVGNTQPVSARQLKVIRLSPDNGAAIVTTIHLDDQHLLAEFDGNSESFLIRGDAVFTINKKNKTYRVTTYQDLLAHFRQKAGETIDSPRESAAGQGFEFKLTGETALISGIQTRKLVATSNGQLQAELWVSRELMPAKLRQIGDNVRDRLPEDYWRRMHGNPGVIEIVILYGIPLKMVLKNRQILMASVDQGSSRGFSFEVPADYKKLDN